jgi:uncharacterized protein DUF3175
MGVVSMARVRKTRISRHSTGRKRAGGKAAGKTSGKKARSAPRSKRWSQRATKHSNALDLERGVFTLRDPKRIASSLKRSAERSSRRKAGAYRSALSMLIFYINRAGKNLPKAQLDRLHRAKVELKRQFGKDR